MFCLVENVSRRIGGLQHPFITFSYVVTQSPSSIVTQRIKEIVEHRISLVLFTQIILLWGQKRRFTKVPEIFKGERPKIIAKC